MSGPHWNCADSANDIRRGLAGLLIGRRCPKGSTRPLGNLANEALRMKRMETHQIFDSFWKERGMSRTQGYKWMAKKLRLSEELAHIGGFEMDRCQKLIRLCEKERNKEKKKETA